MNIRKHGSNMTADARTYGPYDLNWRWTIFSVSSFSALMLTFFLYLGNIEGHASTYMGMVYGGTAVATALFLTAYRLRRALLGVNFGSMRWWMIGHLHLGILIIVPVLMHTNFRFHGFFSLSLLYLFILTIVSGIAGWIIYATIPLSLSKHGGKAFIEEELVELIEKSSDDIKEFLKTTGSRFRPYFENSFGAYIYGRKIALKRLFIGERELLAEVRDDFETAKTMLPLKAHLNVDILMAICLRREKAFARLMRFKIMRWWLDFHVPLTAALLTAISVHVLSMWYY